MPHEQEEKPPPAGDVLFGLFVLVLSAFVHCHELVWRRWGTIGSRHHGVLALLSVCLAPAAFAAALGINEGAEYVTPATGLLVALFLIHKAASVGGRVGRRVHSHHVGTSVLTRVLPESAATAGELVGSVALGCLVGQVSPPVGFFLMAGGAANLAYAGLIEERIRRQVELMEDAEIESRVVAEAYKRRRGL